MPGALLILAQAELQTIQFQVGNMQLPSQQTLQHIGHHPHLIQTNAAGTAAQLHIMHQQQRRKAIPAALQATNAQRHAERSLSLALHLIAVLGYQRHQFATQAGVQRRQHQAQGEQAQDRA